MCSSDLQKMIGDTAARIAAARASADGKEGIRSFLEKRKPAWTATEGAKAGEKSKPARNRKKS